MRMNELAKLSKIPNSYIFSFYANKNLDRWAELADLELNHDSKGSGKFHSAEAGSNGTIYIDMEFTSEEGETNISTINVDIFEQNIEIMHLSENPEIKKCRNSLEEMVIVERKREAAEAKQRSQDDLVKKQEEDRKNLQAANRTQLALLKKKYNILNYANHSVDTGLYVILMKLEEGQDLDNSELTWLMENKMYVVAVEQYRKRHANDSSDIQAAIQAATCYRKLDKFANALKIIDSARPGTVKDKCTLLTIKGGVYRDKKLYQDAKRLAFEAIKINPDDYYPHNLLGGICMDTKEYEDALDYFEKAKRLGSSSKFIHNLFDSSYRKLNPNERFIVVHKLSLKKDLMQYDWAKAYVREFEGK